MSDKILKQGRDPNAAYREFRDRWQAEEAGRLDQVRLAGQVPAAASAEIAPAPARGPVTLFRDRQVSLTDGGNFVTRYTTGAGETGLRCGDAFDVMQDQANRRRGSDAVPRALFTPAQVQAGRTYATLFEKVGKGALKCSSLDGVASGGGGGDFMDAYIHDARRLNRMTEAIGDGWALTGQRAAPHRDRRQPIRSITLLRDVTVRGLTLSRVLARYGWSRAPRNCDQLRDALAACLDRLYGL